MKPLLLLVLVVCCLSQTQSNTYPCLEIAGVGCVCGQGYRNLNGFCTSELSDPQCVTGFVWNGTACAPITPTPPTSETCPTGQVRNNGICVPATSPPNSNNPVCQPNELFIAGRCIAPSGNGNCAAGSTWNGSQCVRTSNPNNPFPTQPTTPAVTQIVCQSGYYFNCQSCVPYRGTPSCLNGCTFNGSTCILSRNNGLSSLLNNNNIQFLSSINQLSNS